MFSSSTSEFWFVGLFCVGVLLLLISALLNLYSLLSSCNCFFHLSTVRVAVLGRQWGYPSSTQICLHRGADCLAQVLTTGEVMVPGTGYCCILISGVRNLHLRSWCHYSGGAEISICSFLIPHLRLLGPAS